MKEVFKINRWPDRHSLKDLWKAVRRDEQLDVIQLPHVAVDRLGLRFWRLRWRRRPDGPWNGFIPFVGGHHAVLQEALGVDANLTEQHLRKMARKRRSKTWQPPQQIKEHTLGSWHNCPACAQGKEGHGRGQL